MQFLRMCRVARIVLATCALMYLTLPVQAADFIAMEGVAIPSGDPQYILWDFARVSQLAALNDTSSVVSGHANLPSRFLCTSTGSTSSGLPVLNVVRVMPDSIAIPAFRDYFPQGPDLASGEGNTVIGSDVHSSFDMDHDGVPTYFESANGSNPAVANASQDFDGDGLSLLAEYQAGTDPRNANSVLRVSATRMSPTQISLSWSSVSGKKYQVQSAGTVPGSFGAVTTVTATGSTSTIQLLPNDTTSFYRVLVNP